MTERPEFVPVFLQSATDIKEFLLSQIPDTWRKEVGDFPYDMIMPDVAQVMQLEIAQDRTLQNAFPQFCEDERMDEHMEIPVCITPIGKPQRVSGTVVTFYNLLITLKEIC